MQLDKGLASVSRVGELLLLCVTLDRGWIKTPTQAVKFVRLPCCLCCALVLCDVGWLALSAQSVVQLAVCTVAATTG